MKWFAFSVALHPRQLPSPSHILLPRSNETTPTIKRINGFVMERSIYIYAERVKRECNNYEDVLTKPRAFQYIQTIVARTNLSHVSLVQFHTFGSSARPRALTPWDNWDVSLGCAGKFALWPSLWPGATFREPSCCAEGAWWKEEVVAEATRCNFAPGCVGLAKSINDWCSEELLKNMESVGYQCCKL